MKHQNSTATFFIDESGAKSTSGNFFVVAGVKCRQPGRLQRRVQELRDRRHYRGEFKFSRISREQLPTFRELVEIVADSDVRVIGAVIDRSRLDNPFRDDDEEWKVHARIAAQLIRGNVSKGEHVAAVLDHVDTKPNVSFGDTVKSLANYQQPFPFVVSAITVDSKANDLLQVADLVAGAVGNQRKDPRPKTVSHKAHVASDLAQALGIPDFVTDTRQGRVNVRAVTKIGRGQSG